MKFFNILFFGTLLLLFTNCNLPKEVVSDVVVEDPVIDNTSNIENTPPVNENPPPVNENSFPMLYPEKKLIKKTITPEIKNKRIENESK